MSLAGVILSLDPSSTRTGYCLMKFDGTIKEAGYVSAQKKDTPIARIGEMIRELRAIARGEWPKFVAIEIPSGKVGRGQRRGASASSMAIYGMAVGAIWWEVRMWYAGRGLIPDLCISAVDERTWTRCVPKAVRNRRIAAQFPAYREQLAAGKDSGGDVGDAIGLALFGLASHRLHERAKGVA